MYSLIYSIRSVRGWISGFLVILVIITLLQMISLFSCSISDSRKTIGILRTIGAGRRDIVRIFTAEELLVTGASLVLGIGLSIGTGVLLNNFICNEFLGSLSIEFYRVRPVNVLAVFALGLLLGDLSTGLPIRKCLKKNYGTGPLTKKRSARKVRSAYFLEFLT